MGSFFDFAEVCQSLSQTNSRLQIAALAADFLARLTPAEAAIAARFMVGRALEQGGETRLNMSGRAVWKIAAALGGGEDPSYHMADAVESWFSGGASDCPGGSDCGYQQMIYSDIISGWQNASDPNNGTNPPCWYIADYYFNSAIPIGAPAGTTPHE